MRQFIIMENVTALPHSLTHDLEMLNMKWKCAITLVVMLSLKFVKQSRSVKVSEATKSARNDTSRKLTQKAVATHALFHYMQARSQMNLV